MSSRPTRSRLVDAARWATLALLVAAAGFVVWVGVDLASVRDDLTAAQASVHRVEQAVREGDQQGLDSAITTAGRSTAEANAVADRFPLRVAASVPWVGRPVDSVRGLARAAGRLATTALPDASTAARTVFAEPLVDRGRVDLAALRRSRPSVVSALTTVTAVRDDVAAVDSDTWVPQVNSAATRFLRELDALRSGLASADRATRVVPAMLGADGPRSIAVVIQNPAEARGISGLPGAVVLLRASGGQVRQQRTIADLAVPAGRSIDLGDDYRRLYGASEPTQLWQNSNQSPHFPYAAQIWRSLIRQQTGTTPDLVVGLDPAVLSGVLDAIGPVRLEDGTTVTGANVVEVTESTVYRRFDDRRAARKDYLGEVATAAVGRLTAGRFDLGTLGRAAATGVSERRLSVWSPRAGEQAELAATTLAHQVPYSPAPYAAVTVNNAYGSKLDYYLERDIEYRYGLCSADRQLARVEATLTNDVPVAAISGLSPEVLGTFLPGSGSLPRGTNRVAVYLYSSWDSVVQGVSVNGTPVGFGSGRELGHPVTVAVVDLPPQTPVTVRFDVSETRSNAAAEVPDQPLTKATQSTVTGTRCGSPE